MKYGTASGVKSLCAAVSFAAFTAAAVPPQSSPKPWFEPAVPKPLLSESTEHQLLSELRRSDPALPEFRLWRGTDNIVRGISSRYTGKNGGAIALTQLQKFPALVHIDLRGVARIDLTGAENFPELRYLRLSGKVSGLSRLKVPKLRTLDLTTADVDSCFPFPPEESLPVLQNLLLPEEITDLRPWTNRIFRALSAPGVADFQAQCKKYSIIVQIRPRKRLNSSSERFFCTYDEKNQLTTIETVHVPYRHRAQDFSEALFPELPFEQSNVPVSPQKPELRLFLPDGKLKALPVKLAWFNDAPQLTKLDLRGIPAVDAEGAVLPQLKELKLSGSIRHLEKLHVPQLESLTLSHVRGFSAGEGRMPRRFSAAGVFPGRAGVEKIRLPQGNTLKELHLSLEYDEFDYSSLEGKKLLRFYGGLYRGKTLDFLRGNPLRVLHLNTENLIEDGAAVLAGMPLEELNLHVSKSQSLACLAKLKLRSLILAFPAQYKGAFRLEYLVGMPLERLHLRTPVPDNWEILGKLPLRELVLSRAELRNPAGLGSLVQLEKLALENCLVPECDMAQALLQLKKLRSLRIGFLYGKNQKIHNSAIAWEKLKALPLEDVSLICSRTDFFRQFSCLRRVKICLLSRFLIEPETLKFAVPPELLILCDLSIRPDRPIPDQRPGTRRPLRGRPYDNPAVAKKILLDSPAIFFIGLFL